MGFGLALIFPVTPSAPFVLLTVEAGSALNG